MQAIQPDSEMTKKLYDIKLINQLSHGKQDLVNHILQVFVEDSQISLQNIKKGLDNADFNAIRQEAHILKSSIMLLSIEELIDNIKEVEELAEKQDCLDRLIVLFSHLESHIQLTINQINKDMNAAK